MSELVRVYATANSFEGMLTKGHLEAEGITVLLKGVRPHHRRVLDAVGTLRALAHERHVFDRLDDAIDHAHQHVARTPHPSAAA